MQLNKSLYEDYKVFPERIIQFGKWWDEGTGQLSHFSYLKR